MGSAYPLFKQAQMYHGVQGVGELFFIPGGNPHGVRNLEAIHGVSMNYVDASNVWIFLWTQLNAARWSAFEMFTDGVSFPQGVSSNQTDIMFGDWKSRQWRDLEFDIM